MIDITGQYHVTVTLRIRNTYMSLLYIPAVSLPDGIYPNVIERAIHIRQSCGIERPPQIFTQGDLKLNHYPPSQI